jgi:hypothetical protein
VTRYDLDKRRFTAVFRNHVNGLLATVFVHVGDNQYGTFTRKRQCRGSTDTGSGSGDEGDFAVQCSWHGVGFSVCNI